MLPLIVKSFNERVIGCYNGNERRNNIQPLVEAINKALAGIGCEVIFVDDGSTDDTRKRIKELVNTRTILVELRKNYGRSTAMTAGIDFTTGK
jgi:glycosyltransferase involved in cell wall biosynthesis